MNMAFPDDTGLVGFDLPSLEEYCGDRDLDPLDENAQDTWRDYCRDCMDDLRHSREKEDE